MRNTNWESDYASQNVINFSCETHTALKEY